MRPYGTLTKMRSERQKNVETLYARCPDFARNPKPSGDFPASFQANLTDLLNPSTESPSPAETAQPNFIETAIGTGRSVPRTALPPTVESVSLAA